MYSVRKKFFCMLLMGFFITGCGGNLQQNHASSNVAMQTVSQTPSGKEPYGKNLYRNKENHFSIVFPDGWAQGGGRGPNVVVVSKNKTGESINIIIKTLPEEFKSVSFVDFSKKDINDYIAGSMDAMHEFYPDASLDDSGTVYINNSKAIWIKTTKTYKNPASTFKLTSIIYNIWKKGKQYTISCFAPPEKYASFEKLFQNAAGSFVIEDGWY